VVGDAVTEIVGVAQETPCDLIVMGTHGRTGLRRALLGSVAEQVMRRAPCPVLTVKMPFPAAQAEEAAVPPAAVTTA
jgi:nucleotide-binding universal stress UspA family protein